MLQLELAGLFTGTPSIGGAGATGGLAARLFVGGRHFGGVVGVDAIGPSTLGYATARARLQRVPVLLGVRGRLFVRRVGFSIDLRLVLSPQITEGLDVRRPLSQTRLEVGIGGALRAEYFASRRLAPFVSFEIEGIPRPYDLTLPQIGVVGQTPRLWLSATAGLAIRLR